MVTLVMTETELESIVRLYGTLLSSCTEADLELDIHIIESIYYKALEAQSKS